MIATRLIGDTVAFFVWVFRRAAATGKPKPQFLEYHQTARIDGIARVCEGYGRRNAVSGELSVDRLHLLLQPREIGLRCPHVVPRVVADFKTIPVQLTDLVPGKVILLVRTERKPFGDEERRAEPVLIQERPDYRVMTRLRVVEGQNHQLVGDGFQPGL